MRAGSEQAIVAYRVLARRLRRIRGSTGDSPLISTTKCRISMRGGQSAAPAVAGGHGRSHSAGCSIARVSGVSRSAVTRSVAGSVSVCQLPPSSVSIAWLRSRKPNSSLPSTLLFSSVSRE